MKDPKAASEEQSQIWTRPIMELVCKKLAEIIFLRITCEYIRKFKNIKNKIPDLIFALSDNIEIWENFLSLLIVKNDIKYNLSYIEKILRSINFDYNDISCEKFIEQYQQEWRHFFFNYLSHLERENDRGTNIFDKVRNEIHLFVEKSKRNIKEEVESISQNGLEKILNFASNQAENWKIANNLIEKIVIDFKLSDKNKNISNIIDILDSRIDKVNELLKYQKIEFKNNFIDLENSFKEKEEELKNQVENNIQTIKENFEGAVSRIGMEKAFREASDRIRKGRYWAFVGFILGLILLFSVGCFLLFSNLDGIDEQGHWSVQELVHTAGRYVAIAAIVWWTWFIAKRFSQLVKIEEDYAFKETMVLSYKGYHEEVRDNEELYRELLHLTIKMFAENPTRLLEKRECALPVQELVTIITDSLKVDKK